MTFRDKARLLVLGHTIQTEYSFKLSEEAFREYAKSKFEQEEDMKLFSLSSKPFVGELHGYYSREFTIKPKKSFFRKNSIGNNILIHGKVEPIKHQCILLQITYHRPIIVKYGCWVLICFLFLMFLIISLSTLPSSDFSSFFILSGVLASFYLFASLIMVLKISGGIKYFEKHFIKELIRDRG